MTSPLFSADDLAALAAPHVARAWLGEFDLPSGLLRLHSGCGRVEAGGVEWLGVSDPDVPGRLVSVATVTEPRFGSAAAVTISLGGVTADFMRSLREVPVEGRAARIFWALFDAETQEVVLGPRLLFPRGRITAPARSRDGLGSRRVTLTVEGPWSSLNYPIGGRWNDADQQRRHPGDLGLQFVGVDVVETPQ